jgi:hypothetical protein
LFGAIRSAENHGTDNSVTIDYCSPFLISQAAVCIFALLHDLGKSGFELSVIGKLGAVRGLGSGARKNSNYKKQQR